MNKNLLLLFSVLFPFAIKASDTLSNKSVIDTLGLELYIKYDVNAVSNEKNGNYEMIFKSKTLTKGHYIDGKRTGEWIFAGMNDSIQLKGSYVNGKREGEWRSFYSDGTLSCILNFKNDLKDGLTKAYFKNGNTSFEKTFIKGDESGIFTQYYENGKINLSETYQGDTLNGLAKKYYESGVLKEEKYMRGYSRDSSYKFYYEDGSLWEDLIYRNGGVYKVNAYYSSDGKPLNCCSIKNGTGTMRFYDKNGKITDEVQYENCIKNGYAKYYKDGQINMEGNFSNNEKDGVWKDYYKTGELFSVISYSHGKTEGDAIYYYSSGKINREGKYLDGKSTNVWKSYGKEGELISEVAFLKGQPEGETKYYENGKVVAAGMQSKGARVGMWKFYDKKGDLQSGNDYGYPNLFDKETPPDPPMEKMSNMTVLEKEDILTIVERMPSFPGGEKEMMNFIVKNIHYPDFAREAGVQGTVYITFVVSFTGEVVNIKILRGREKSLDAEAMRIVSIMPRWTAGNQGGQPVSVQFNLPIKYTLR